MEPRIIVQGAMIIAGMVYYGKPFQDTAAAPELNEIGKLWTRFSSYCEKHASAIGHQVNPRVGWELHITTEEYQETKAYYVMVGVEVSQIESLPEPIFVKVLPEGQYAVFTLRGEQMTSNWGHAIYEEWLPSSAYVEAFGCTIERYDEDRFRAWGDPDSEVEIWVPIEAKP